MLVTLRHNWPEKSRRAARLYAVACCVCLPVMLAPASATARADHTHRIHHYYAPAYTTRHQLQPDTGFGPTAPGVSSILIDAKSGAVIAAQGADIPRYPASLTKLMTLDLAFQALRDGRLTLDTQIPMTTEAAAVEPVKLGLPAGSEIPLRDIILAMTTMSANDAATALGDYLGGNDLNRFAQMMTLRAHTIGMAQTQFANPSGLPNPNQVTTARDMAILARDIVVSYPQYQPFFTTISFNYAGRTIYSNNQMLKLYPGTTGMKTGYTILARHNLITSAEQNGRVLIGVELHEDSWGATYQQMTAMLNTGFGGSAPNAATQLADNTPPAIPAPLPTGPTLFAQADAATIRPAIPPAHLTTTGPNGWTAQLGSFAHMKTARLQALQVHRLQGVGIARVAQIQRHGKTLWTAQLTGLSRLAAHITCHSLTERGQSCTVIAPQDEHLAMSNAPSAMVAD